MHRWLTALALLLCFISTAIANEPKINEHKNNWTGNTISNADDVCHADRHPTVDVDTVTDIAAPDFYMQMQRRTQQSPTDYVLPADMQQRRNLFLKQMEERKQIMDRIRDAHRKAVEMRRKERRLQMNQTNIKADIADQA